MKSRWKYLSKWATQWICLRLPSWGTRFEYQALHLRGFQIVTDCDVERTKINKNMPGFAHIEKDV